VLSRAILDVPRSEMHPAAVGSGGPAPVGRRRSPPPGSSFSPHLLTFTLAPDDGARRRLTLLDTLSLVQRWREAILSHANGVPARIREVLSGHARDGAPLDSPHLAFLPVAAVDDRHADGRLLGMSLALPEDLTPLERGAAVRVLGRVQRLVLGRLGAWTVEPSRLPRRRERCGAELRAGQRSRVAAL
jgi:CRISPR-associated protein Csb2